MGSDAELASLRAENLALQERLKESEERFRQVTDYIDEIFWMTDPRKNQMFFISKAYERTWGRTCESLLQRPLSFIETVHEDDRQRVIESFPLQANGTYDIEYRYLRPDGEVGWVRDRAFPVEDESGEVYRIVGVVNEITQTKRLYASLAREKEKEARLLANVLPKSIIATLKGSEASSVRAPAVAERFADTTILFADIVGFTQLSERLSAAETVDVLNEIFTAFDDICDREGVEKVRTIGDGYMAVAGAPEPRDDHPQALTRVALAMCAYMAGDPTGHGLRIRVGLNTGEAVGAIVGTRRFHWDLWSDAVNVAARMESSGEPGRVQVARATWERIRDEFECEPRGAIEIKGKGPIETWFVRS